MKKYPLATSSWGEEEISAIQKVIDSDIYTMGENVAAFEREFANYCGSKYCVMVNSGSSANLLMVAALFYREKNELKRGDEVIVPAVSWSTTYYPLYQYGLKLKFVDIDANTLNYDLNKLEQAVSDKTKMIMAVNLLGNPNDFDAIQQIIKERDIILIEDNCESMGAEYKGKKAGAIGLMGSFSSFFSHHISTMEGGMVVTDDEELYHIMISMRAHGWTRGLPKENKVCGQLSDDNFYESFRFVLPGYNLRPMEMSGAIGLKQLEKLPEFVSIRRSNAKLYKELFSNSSDFIIQDECEKSSWFGFSFILKEDSDLARKDVINILNENHIDCRPIVAGNFTRNPVIKWMEYEIFGELTNANRVHDYGFFVGNHQMDISEELTLLHRLLG